MKLQVRRPSRRTVYLDTGDVFGISGDVFLSRPVAAGDELSDQDLEEYRTLEARESVRNSALNLLSYRMRSKSELQQRLLQKGFNQEEVDSVILDLEMKEFINDAEFAHAFARDKIRERSLGPIALKRELLVHGLDVSLIEEVMEEIYRTFPPNILIAGLLDKRKIQRGSSLSIQEKKRLTDFLKRKGYPWDLIKNSLEDREVM